MLEENHDSGIWVDLCVEEKKKYAVRENSSDLNFNNFFNMREFVEKNN